MKRWGQAAVAGVRRLVKKLRSLHLLQRPGIRAALGHGLRVGTALGGLLLLDLSVHAHLARRPELQVEAPRFHWPASVALEATATVDRRLLEIRADTLDDALITRLGSQIAQDPWVKKLHRLQRVYPSGLELDVEFRKPFLAVRSGEGYVLLDADAVRLPGRASDLPPVLATPVVVGAMMGPPAPGEVWESREIRAAFEMVRLRDRSLLGTLPITAIDISNLGGRLNRHGCEIVLRLRNGCEIQWGAPPSGRRPAGEADLEAKLTNLKRILEADPALDAELVDVTKPGRVDYVSKEEGHRP